MNDLSSSARMHNLKIAPEMISLIISGEKRAEFRRDDRDPRFEVGDGLVLTPWTEQTGYARGFCIVRITHIVRGPAFEVPEGYAVLSIALQGSEKT